VKGLVEKYNDVISYITAQSRYDAATKTAGLLAGDLTLRQAQTQISSALTQSIQSEGYSLQVLSQVGIKLTNSGTLSLDETKLRDRLSANFTDTAHLLLSDATDAEGNVVSLIPTLRGRLRTFTDSVDGTVQHVTEGLQKNISRINEQVEAMEARLEVRREILILQYQKADEALKQLSVLQSSLTSQMDILSSL
jgi:flagellar hook-associated protein 2